MKKREYVPPQVSVYGIEAEGQLLAGSKLGFSDENITSPSQAQSLGCGESIVGDADDDNDLYWGDNI